MNYIVNHKILYYSIQFTWGLLINIIGFIVFLSLLIFRKKPKKFNNNIYFVVGKDWGGLSLGIFFICGERNETDHTKCHEYGHGIQNVLFGPLFIFLVCIPSAIRYWYRELKYYKKGLNPSTKYDDIWFEGQATKFGYRYSKKD